MRALRHSTLLPLALGMLALLCASVVLMRAHRTATAAEFIRDGKVNFTAAEQFWTRRIKSEGGTHAYQDLLTLSANISAGEGHTFAHAFGDALYKTQGVDALSVCGQDLFWGCFHQFVGDAIADHGLGIIPQLDAGCAPSGVARTECEHGLGHGILGYFGYTGQNLSAALAECDAIEPGHPRSGCSEGAIMEYDLRELASVDTGAPLPRPLAEGIYSPCLDLPARYQSACGYDLPIWWGALASTYATSFSAAFAWIGTNCESAPDAALKRSCEEGLGFAAYLTRGTAGAGFCGSAALSTAGQRECRAAFAGSMHPTDTAAAQAACAAAGARDDAYCLQYARSDERDRETIPAP